MRTNQQLNTQLRETAERSRERADRLREKDERLREKDERLRQLREEIQQNETQLQQKEVELQLRNADISRLQKQLQVCVKNHIFCHFYWLCLEFLYNDYYIYMKVYD